jgi:hypothetical protein
MVKPGLKRMFENFTVCLFLQIFLLYRFNGILQFFVFRRISDRVEFPFVVSFVEYTHHHRYMTFERNVVGNIIFSKNFSHIGRRSFINSDRSKRDCSEILAFIAVQYQRYMLYIGIQVTEIYSDHFIVKTVIAVYITGKVVSTVFYRSVFYFKLPK